ncbi:hypothetical protein D3C81_397950 [compost metagenome]
MQVRVAVGQKTYLQPLDQLLDITGAGHQARDRNQAAGLGRDPLAIVQARQKAGHYSQCHQPVDQANCQAAGHQQDGYGEPCQHWRGPAIIVDRPEEDSSKDQREQHHWAQVETQGRFAQQPLPAFAKRHGGRQALFEQRQPRPDQVETYMICWCLQSGGGGTGQFDGDFGNARFVVRAVACQTFDDMAIMIAAGKVHERIDRCRVLAEDPFDMAQAFDELPPIAGRQHAQTTDAVADRYLVRRLLLRIKLHLTFDTEPGLGEHLLDPRQRLAESGTLPLKAPGQLGDETSRHRWFGAGHVSDHQDHILDVALSNFAQSIGPVVGQVAVAPVGHDPRGDAPQVLDQCQAQHDRNRPQFTQGQWGHGLITLDEAAQALAVDAAITMGDGLQGNVIDARQIAGRAIGQAGQLAAVAGRQMRLSNADVRFDQVVVVQ